MKVNPECIRCIVNTRINEILGSLGSIDETIDIQIDLLREAHRVFKSGKELTRVATEIYRWLVNRAPRVAEYYRNIKRKGIDRALAEINRYRALIEGIEGYEKFRVATKISIAGNLLDSGVYGHSPPERLDPGRVLGMEFSIDDTKRVYGELVGGGKNVLWLFDNAGEAVYDIVLVETIRGYGNRVIGVVKEDPGFQNDLTVEDVVYAGLERYFDEIVSMGYSGATIHLDEISRELKKLIALANLVIAKGMAHYEYVSEVDLGKPVWFLLVPKCEPISRSLGVERYTLVAFYRG
ncbi:MAG: hypothetical protein DRO13_05390 [Thermoprotei archaeon]|nr:MAG: hypothetical protein DRO13_05390 [Thermoprotei archaeon]